MIEKTAISFRISIEHVEKLKKVARKISYKEDKDITYIDLIRNSYEKEYGLEVEDNEKINI